MSKITVKELKKSYGKKEVLRDVSFEAQSGERVCVIGANGSGKSTLLLILGGILGPDGGSFFADGRDMFKDRRALRAFAGLVPQNSPLMEELTARDNLRLWYTKKGLEASLDSGALKTLGVEEYLNVPVRKLSGGMKKRLAIGCALCGDPGLLLMDEPSAALDIISRRRLEEYTDSLCRVGKTVITVTHELDELPRANHAFLLKNGVLFPCDSKDPDAAARELEKP